jgi:signal peptidase I
MSTKSDRLIDLEVEKNATSQLADVDEKAADISSEGDDANVVEREISLVDEQDEGEPDAGWMMLRELVETIVLALIIFLLMRQVIQNYRIESHSMEPNFAEGQFILVNKLAYVFGEPSRGDVVVFHNPRNEREDYIKRIIGLPGDTVEIVDGQVRVNGQAIEEPFIANKNRAGERFGPLIVDPGYLFVMGDNRPNSSDGRSFGPLDQELVVGQAWLRVWPFRSWGLVNHEDIDLGVPTAALSPKQMAPAHQP